MREMIQPTKKKYKTQEINTENKIVQSVNCIDRHGAPKDVC
jgi:hypothetical protein